MGDTELPPWLVEKIVAFVEREAGRDAPLSAADDAMVRDRLTRDSAVQALVATLRANNQALDGLLDDTSTVDVPDELVAVIRGHGSNNVLIASRPDDAPGALAEGRNARPWYRRQSISLPFGLGTLAAAASVVLAASFGTFAYLYTGHQAERQRLETRLVSVTDALREGEEALADASIEIERMTAMAQQSSEQSTEQRQLQRRIDGALAENRRLGTLLLERDTAFAEAVEQRKQLEADLSSMALAMRETAALDMTARGLDPSPSDDLADLNAAQQALQSRIDGLETENRQLARNLEASANEILRSSEEVAVLRSNLVLAERAGAATAKKVAVLQSDLSASKSWLGQIAQNHRVYSATERSFLVEVGANQAVDIERWAASTLDRPVTVPDLSAEGVIFQGARLLGVNGKPVTQLIYLDRDDQPLALCIIASDKEAIAPSLSADRDINMVEWRDGRHGYALVGWSDSATMESLAETIRPFFNL